MATNSQIRIIKKKSNGVGGKLNSSITVKPGQAYTQEFINEFIIQKLNPLLVVDFRLISAFLYV